VHHKRNLDESPGERCSCSMLHELVIWPLFGAIDCPDIHPINEDVRKLRRNPCLAIDRCLQ
jgi:hypothetical protein